MLDLPLDSASAALLRGLLATRLLSHGWLVTVILGSKAAEIIPRLTNLAREVPELSPIARQQRLRSLHERGDIWRLRLTAANTLAVFLGVESLIAEGWRGSGSEIAKAVVELAGELSGDDAAAALSNCMVPDVAVALLAAFPACLEHPQVLVAGTQLGRLAGLAAGLLAANALAAPRTSS